MSGEIYSSYPALRQIQNTSLFPPDVATTKTVTYDVLSLVQTSPPGDQLLVASSPLLVACFWHIVAMWPSLTFPLIALCAMLRKFLRTVLLLTILTFITLITIIQFRYCSYLLSGYRPQLHASTKYTAAIAVYFIKTSHFPQRDIPATLSEFTALQPKTLSKSWLRMKNYRPFIFQGSSLRIIGLRFSQGSGKMTTAKRCTPVSCRTRSSLCKQAINSKFLDII